VIKINRPSDPPKKQRKRKKAKKSFRYNEDRIVAELWKMQHGKCCYCEEDIPEKGHAKAVEHFKPKSVFKSLTNDWDNLLLACAQCNGKKSDLFPIELTSEEEEPKVIYIKRGSKERCVSRKNASVLLIDPSKENPEKYLDFVVDLSNSMFGLIHAKKNRRKGIHTIKVIGLDDWFYHKKNRDFLRDALIPTLGQMTRAADLKDQTSVDARKRDFEQWMADSYRIAGFTRAFARHYGLEKYGISIPSDN